MLKIIHFLKSFFLPSPESSNRVKVMAILGFITTSIPACLVTFFEEDYQFSSEYIVIQEVGLKVFWLIPAIYILVGLFVRRLFILFCLAPITVSQLTFIRFLRSYFRFEDNVISNFLCTISRIYSPQEKLYYLSYYKTEKMKILPDATIDRLINTSTSIKDLNRNFDLEVTIQLARLAEKAAWDDSWSVYFLNIGKQVIPNLIIAGLTGLAMYLLGKWATQLFKLPSANASGSALDRGPPPGPAPANTDDIRKINRAVTELAQAGQATQLNSLRLQTQISQHEGYFRTVSAVLGRHQRALNSSFSTLSHFNSTIDQLVHSVNAHSEQLNVARSFYYSRAGWGINNQVSRDVWAAADMTPPALLRDPPNVAILPKKGPTRL